MTSNKERQEVKPEFYRWLNSWADKEKTSARLKPLFGTATEVAAFKLGYNSAITDILEKVKSVPHNPVDEEKDDK